MSPGLCLPSFQTDFCEQSSIGLGSRGCVLSPLVGMASLGERTLPCKSSQNYSWQKVPVDVLCVHGRKITGTSAKDSTELFYTGFSKFNLEIFCLRM